MYAADIVIENGGVIKAGYLGIAAENAYGNVSITNRGTVEAAFIGIGAMAGGNVTLINEGTVDPFIGMAAISYGDGHTARVVNKGSVEADLLGIGAFTVGLGNSTIVANSGTITTTGLGDDPYDCGCLPFDLPGSAAIFALSDGAANSKALAARALRSTTPA